ncbi:MAG TPA: 50S ribosomal protein L24 [Gemmatimonadaceae bacterium]|jgi:large subunit ribosomal protein L24|nr:50S ribosomal protein L24 [Gemmatimonadaceae bacterium]
MRNNKYYKTDRGQRLGASRHALKASREPVHVTTGDVVRVMRGDDKGKEGKVIRVYHKTGRITVEGVNIVKKHRRARTAEEQSGIIEMAAPFAASNVMLIDPQSGKPTRVRAQVDKDGTKERIAVKSGQSIARNR